MNSLPVCQTLLLERHNGVLHITLNRPDSRNAMSLQMVAELRAVLAAVRDDRQVRALVIGGAGGHFFVPVPTSRTWPMPALKARAPTAN